MKSFLVLQNGTVFEGKAFGKNHAKIGEVVFNTAMAGYQEILTDPSYRGQIVTLTYPMVGNYGINANDMESSQVQAFGLVAREYVSLPSNYQSTETLHQFLERHGVPGIEGIDTRKLTRILRNSGAMNGGIFPSGAYSPEFLERVKAHPSMIGLDLAKEVTTDKAYVFGNHSLTKRNVAVYDFGVKTNILRLLDSHGFNVHVFPATTQAEDLMRQGFDAYFFSNGPGDPEPCTYAIENAKVLLQARKPIFGICLGHQILGLALGKKTTKLKFGHRGGNHPVRNLETNKVEITSQNHGFHVLEDGKTGTPTTRLNLFDNTVAGLKSDSLPILTVQYHPEACPGPNDSQYHFGLFYDMVTKLSSTGGNS